MKEITDLFMKNPVKIISVLLDGDTYISDIVKKTDTTQASVSNYIDRMKELNLVKKKNMGRIVVVSLTPMGRELAVSLNEIRVRLINRVRRNDS